MTDYKIDLIKRIYAANLLIQQCKRLPRVTYGVEERQLFIIFRSNENPDYICVSTYPLGEMRHRTREDGTIEIIGYHTHPFSLTYHREILEWICKAVEIEYERSQKPEHYEEAKEIWVECNEDEVIEIEFREKKWRVMRLEDGNIQIEESPCGLGAEQLEFGTGDVEYSELLKLITETGPTSFS